MKKYIILLFCLICLLPLHSQTNTAYPDETRDKLAQSYFRMAGEHSPLYSGKLHRPYLVSIKDHPFFVTSDCRTGSVGYDGVYYQEVSLRLDLYRDELITCSPTGMNVIIAPDKVDSVFINGYRVIYHQPDRWEGSPPSGYYMQLHKGRYTVLERRTSQLREFIKDLKLEREFLHSVRFYILKDGKYHQVKSKSSILRLFRDRKRELKQFIKQQSPDFRNDPENAIVASVEYYENLNP